MPIAFLAAALILAVPIAPAAQDTAAADVPVRLLPHAELSAALADLAARHPDLVTVDLVGHSRAERAIEALRLTAPGEDDGRPAILLVANLEGPRVFESGVALHHAERLAAGWAAGDEAARALLETAVVWVLPRANPDPAEARFETPREERWASGGGVDDDRDGRSGEDPRSDVDGDGLVTWMRVPDPEGTWMEDPAEPRVLIEADRDKGQRGRWRLVREGRDLDADEEAAEDGPNDARVDRNFPSGWEEHEPETGVFATDEPETRALCEFVMERPNLVLVLAYDGLDNLVEEPKSVEDDAKPVMRVPAPGVLASDAGLLKEIGRRYREATGSEATGSSEDAGTFQRWCYDHRGLWTLAAVLWNAPTEAPPPEDEQREDENPRSEDEEGEDDADDEDEGDEDAPEPSEDVGRLAWAEAVGEEWRFVDWTPYEHPELGPVEVGGFAPFAELEPPVSEQAEIADRSFAFFVGLGELLPRTSVAECTLERVGDGLWKVTAVVQNDGFLPFLSRSAQRTRTIRPVRMRLVHPEAATVVAGASQVLVRDLPGSGGRHEETWLLSGPDGMQVGVTIDSDLTGTESRDAEVVE